MGITNVGLGASSGNRSARRAAAVAAATLIAGALAIASPGCKKTAAIDDGQKSGVIGQPAQTPPTIGGGPAQASPMAGTIAASSAAAPGDSVKPKHPPRRLEDGNRKELESTLPRGAPVEITAPEGDEEAYRVAQEIRIFLRSEKYGVADIVRRPPDPSAKGVGLEPLPGGKWRVIVGEPE